MAVASTNEAFDWPAYVDVMSALHDLELDSSRREAVIEQLRRIHGMAQGFLDFPLPAEIEPAPTFRP